MAGYKINLPFKTVFLEKCLQFSETYDKINDVEESICRRVGMADEADSKSVVGNHVRVQVPLPAVTKKR